VRNREVFKILPPIPFSSFGTLSLSGDRLLTSTKRADPRSLWNFCKTDRHARGEHPIGLRNMCDQLTNSRELRQLNRRCFLKNSTLIGALGFLNVGLFTRSVLAAEALTEEERNNDRRGFPGRIRGRNRFRPRRRESLEKISESVTKTEIRLDKIIPAGMTPTADPVVGRFPEEADMRGKAVL
jgi:hypothetical protein